MCLDARPLDECKFETDPLQPGKTVFFVVQPRFMNVDIRIILDVTQGEVDFFMSSNDDSFVVLTNHSNEYHEILLDNKYQWLQDIENQLVNPNYSIPQQENTSTQSYSDDVGSSDCRSTGRFHVFDRMVKSITTHITLDKCNTILRVYALKNRLVVTLPQNIHNLSGTRFFIAVRSANHTTTGLIFFRQVTSKNPKTISIIFHAIADKTSNTSTCLFSSRFFFRVSSCFCRLVLFFGKQNKPLTEGERGSN